MEQNDFFETGDFDFQGYAPLMQSNTAYENKESFDFVQFDDFENCPALFDIPPPDYKFINDPSINPTIDYSLIDYPLVGCANSCDGRLDNIETLVKRYGFLWTCIRRNC